MHINYLAVLVAAIINMGLGAAWYSSLLFAKPWMKATGKSMEDMKGAGTGYAVTAVGSLVMALLLAYFTTQVDAGTFAAGAKIGLLAWVGFVVPTHAGSYIFEGRSLQLYAINIGYYLVALMLMGGLVAAWH
jgi:Protein of unknown function (DUF1761)